MMTFFIIIQAVLLLFMLFHDFVSVPPFNNIEDLKKVDSRAFRLRSAVINSLPVFIPLILTLMYCHKVMPLFVMVFIASFYCLLTIGTVLSWWTPYFFGSSAEHKLRFSKFKNTHHFLPARGDNVVPNTLHVVLHLQVWMCFVMSLYFLLCLY